MPSIKLIHQNAYPWHEKDGIYAKGFIFTSKDQLLEEDDLISYFADCQDIKSFKNKLSDANGMFSVIIQRDGFLMAAVDRLRCFPIFYRKINNDYVLSDDVDYLFDNQKDKKINKLSEKVFGATGYTIGDSTLLQNVHQLQGGELLKMQNGQKESDFYFQFAKNSSKLTFDEVQSELADILIHRIGPRLVKVLRGRPVAIPLSGGFDSRLIALLLYLCHYPNVICFTYGKRQGNDEIKRSEAVAKQLGFNWYFIDYQKNKNINILQDEEFLNYCRYASQYSSKFYFSEYWAAKYLIDEIRIPKNTVFIPGHTGDVMAGSHLRPFMKNYSSLKQVAQDLMSTHFNLVETDARERRNFRQILINQLSNLQDDKFDYWQLSDAWDVRERQAKYIINSCKLWEFFGFSYLIPLWDAELADFFAALPFELRLNKKLYDNVLRGFFDNQKILFKEDISLLFSNNCIDNIKQWIKRNFPFIQKKKDIFEHDIFDFRAMTTSMMKEIQKGNRKKTLRHYNGIMSEWYLYRIENELNKE